MTSPILQSNWYDVTGLATMTSVTFFPRFHGVTGGHVEIVDFLLARGAILSDVDAVGNTPLL